MNSTIDYWNNAAKDPEVDKKYICDIPWEDCQLAKGSLPMPTLDLGCGIGRMMENNSDYYGIDISPEMIKLAKKRKPKAHFKVCNGKTIPYKDKMFKSVFSMLTFQHIDEENVLDYIYEVARVLTDGGIFRFQYIAGVQDNFIDHHHNTARLIDYLQTAGFGIAKFDERLVHPQWTWIMAVKL